MRVRADLRERRDGAFLGFGLFRERLGAGRGGVRRVGARLGQGLKCRWAPPGRLGRGGSGIWSFRLADPEFPLQPGLRNGHIGQRAENTVRAASARNQVPQVYGAELSVSGGLSVGEKEGPRSPIRILPVNEQGQPWGRGHGQYRTGSKNNPRDRPGSKPRWITRDIELRLRGSSRVVKPGTA